MSRLRTIGSIVCFISICLLTGCSGSDGGSDGGSTDSDNQEEETLDVTQIDPSSIETFLLEDGDICMEDGKPVISMFSTTSCPHCTWVSDAFDPVVEMYVEEGLIVAHHWELVYVDGMLTGDDIFTDEIETDMPDTEMEVYDKFSGGSVPTFVFGCKYYRVGTAYEGTDDLEAEAAEFMAVIEELIAIE